MNTAVLFIVFNRPDTTQISFDAIQKAKPKKLYIAADGPRKGVKEDLENCKIVREIVSNIDWDCEVFKRFSEINQGCGPGPFNAMKWAFEKEDKLIILEDDCVASPAFFPYCEELLNRYENDTRIWLISGNQYNEEAVTSPHSYFFSKYGHSWGWASWKRCFNEVDLEMRKLPKLIEQGLFESMYRSKEEVHFFKKRYENIYFNRSNYSHIWDIPFGFSLRTNNHLCIVPRKNLVKNIGHIGTHSEKLCKFHNRATDDNFKIESHPDFILCDIRYDDYHFKHHWKRRPLLRRIINRIIKLSRKKCE